MNFEYIYPFLNQARDSDSPDLLGKLARHPNFRVRAAVASNKNTAKQTFMFLRQDRMWMIHVNMVRNSNVPREIIDAALQHENPIMVAFALSNSQVAADEVMQRIQVLEFDRASRRDICSNPNLSDEQRREIQGR